MGQVAHAFKSVRVLHSRVGQTGTCVLHNFIFNAGVGWLYPLNIGTEGQMFDAEPLTILNGRVPTYTDVLIS